MKLESAKIPSLFNYIFKPETKNSLENSLSVNLDTPNQNAIKNSSESFLVNDQQKMEISQIAKENNQSEFKNKKLKFFLLKDKIQEEEKNDFEKNFENKNNYTNNFDCNNQLNVNLSISEKNDKQSQIAVGINNCDSNGIAKQKLFRHSRIINSKFKINLRITKTLLMPIMKFFLNAKLVINKKILQI